MPPSNEPVAELDSLSSGKSTIDILNEGDTPSENDNEEVIIEGSADSDDLLADKSKEKKESKKTDDEDEKIELKEDDDEEEKPFEDKLELVTPAKKKEILAKYPNVFKDFPYLEKAYYREREYTEILPTLEDAKEAVGKANQFDEFSGKLLEGNIENVFKAVEEGDKDAFGKIVDDLLPALRRVNKDAFAHVTGSLIKQAVGSMYGEGDRIQNEDLKNAAVILHQFFFGSSEFKPHGKFGPDSPNKDNSVSEERAKFQQERFEAAYEDISTRSSNVVKSTISQHIDPKGAMTDYVKRSAVNDAMQQVEKIIASDARFKSVLDKLWQDASRNGYSKKSVEAIKSAYLSKAKTILPSVIQKARNEALRGLGKRVADDREEPSRRGPVTSGRPAPPNSRSDQLAMKKGEKTLDFFMRD